MELTTTTKGNFWLITNENRPVESEIVPLEEPLTDKLTADNPSWFSPTILPLKMALPFNWATTTTGIKNKRTNIFFILLNLSLIF